jgi:hypothetical protein
VAGQLDEAISGAQRQTIDAGLISMTWSYRPGARPMVIPVSEVARVAAILGLPELGTEVIPLMTMIDVGVDGTIDPESATPFVAPELPEGGGGCDHLVRAARPALRQAARCLTAIASCDTRRMSDSGFVATYARMLQDVGQRAGEMDGRLIASHWPFVGSDFRGTVIVGQALAGWDAEVTTARWQPELARTEEGRQEIIEGTRAWATARPEPMDEVLRWGHRRRSPFWGLSQRLDRLLEPGAPGPWYSHHAWWNVYPLGFDRPGASPWGALKEAQAPHVGRLFWEAMDFLGARRVVIVAGKDWWPDVRQRLGLEALEPRSMPIITSGRRSGLTIVSTYHPGAHIASLTRDAFSAAIAAEIKEIEADA